MSCCYVMPIVIFRFMLSCSLWTVCNKLELELVTDENITTSLGDGKYLPLGKDWASYMYEYYPRRNETCQGNWSTNKSTHFNICNTPPTVKPHMGYELISGLTPFFTLLGGEMDEDFKSKCKIPCQKTWMQCLKSDCSIQSSKHLLLHHWLLETLFIRYISMSVLHINSM